MKVFTILADNLSLQEYYRHRPANLIFVDKKTYIFLSKNTYLVNYNRGKMACDFMLSCKYALPNSIRLILNCTVVICEV